MAWASTDLVASGDLLDVDLDFGVCIVSDGDLGDLGDWGLRTLDRAPFPLEGVFGGGGGLW